ncbi:MAG: GNAT family N-acetyltransferase [Armatimonadetes bacterium]|nr:GNAT family N-acetyltransferase [Armatimonadota bacterium]
MSLELRSPTQAELHLVAGFIRELAEYEKLAHECVITEELLDEALFGPRPYAETLLAFADGVPVGFCLFFHNFSTFLGKPGLYLEDLYIKPEHRNRGYGKVMLSHLAQLALDRGCGRFEWSVLDWNEPSIAFYRKIGAVPMDEWTVQRVTGQALIDLATSTS